MTDYAAPTAFFNDLAEADTFEYMKRLTTHARAVAVKTFRVIARHHELMAQTYDDDCFVAISEGRHADAKRLSSLALEEMEAAWDAHRKADTEMTAAFRASLN